MSRRTTAACEGNREIRRPPRNFVGGTYTTIVFAALVRVDTVDIWGSKQHGRDQGEG